MSTRQSKKFIVVALVITLATGSLLFQWLGSQRAAEDLAEYYAAAVLEGQQAIQQSLEERGLVQYVGSLHEPAPNSDSIIDTSPAHCYPVNVDSVLECELATVRILDLHNCNVIEEGRECRSGGQLVISSRDGQFDEVFISFELLNSAGGKFEIVMPSDKRACQPIKRAFEQFAPEPGIASRQLMNNVLVKLFRNARNNTIDEQLGHLFLKIILNSVHHELLVAQAFERPLPRNGS